MTCIVGIEHEGVVYLGADSLSGNGYTSDSIAEAKCFRSGDYVIGVAGSWRVMDLVRYLQLPEPPKYATHRYVTNTLVPIIRKTLLRGGIQPGPKGPHGEADPDSGPSMLLGFRGRLFRIETDYCVLRSKTGYATIGSGEPVALGSLATTAGGPCADWPEHR